jgi:carboxypeptidase Taq
MRSNKQSETDTIHNPKMVARKTKRHPIDRPANRQSCSAILADLKNRLSEIYDLNAAGSVLSWDEATYMPNGGAVSRGRQLAMLRRLAHERLVDPTLGRLMDQLEPRVDKLSADDVSLLRVVRRDYEKAIKVPAEYVARANAHYSRSYNAWTRARPRTTSQQ